MINSFKIPLVVDHLGEGKSSLGVSFSRSFEVLGGKLDDLPDSLDVLGTFLLEETTYGFGSHDKELRDFAPAYLEHFLEEIFRRFFKSESLGSLIQSLDVPSSALGALATTYLGGMLLSLGCGEHFYSCGVPLHSGWQAVLAFFPEPVARLDSVTWEGESIFIEGLRTANDDAVARTLKDVSYSLQELSEEYATLDKLAQENGGSPAFLGRNGAIVGSWFYRGEAASRSATKAWKEFLEHSAPEAKVLCVQPEFQGLSFS